MNKRILVTYKSVTGFTKQYAEWIAQELHCDMIEFKKVSSGRMSEYDVIIFGGRFHAGSVDGLKKAKELFKASTAKQFVIFATGASPDTTGSMIEDAWKNNLTTEEASRIPHFYMPGGLRYERMPWKDKLMMKAFSAMVKSKKEKDDYEKTMERMIKSSYDLSSKEYIKPLVSLFF